MKSRLYFNISFLLIINLLFQFSSRAQDVLSLEDCINIAMQNNSRYKNTQNRQEIAESQVLSAYSQILPKLSFGLGGSQQHLGSLTRFYNTAVYKYGEDGKPVADESGNPIVERYVKTLNETDPQIRNNFNMGLNFSQLIYDGGQWWNRLRTQNSNKEARIYETEISRLNTVTDVKRYYYELLKAQNQLIVLEESVQLALGQLNSSQTRYEIGDVIEIDVLRSKVNYNDQKIQFITQKNEVNIARADLNAIMGRHIYSPLIISEDSTINDVPVSLQEVFRFAERNNPSIKMVQKEIDRAYYSYKSAKGAFLPTLAANLSYSRFNPDMQLVYRDFNRNYSWTYGLSFSFPIFDGLKTKSDIQYGYYNLKIAEENFSDTERTVIKGAEQYYQYLKSNLDKIKLLKENLIAAEENVRLASELYNVGSGTLLETIDAQVSFTRSRILLVRAIYDAKISLAQLEGLLGVESIQDIR